MKTAFGSIAVLALGLSVFAAAACEAQDCDVTRETPDGGTETTQGTCFKSLKTWSGNASSQDVAYVAGGSVTIDSRNGSVRVEQGSAGTVKATVTPFVTRAFDTPQSTIDADLAQLHLNAGGDASLVTVATTRDSGSPSTLGGNIVVSLPPEFDGELKIIQDNGSVDVNFVGAATHLGIASDNGACEFDAGSTARTVDITCDNGDIKGTIPVPADAAGGKVSSGNGTVELGFGTGATPFNVSAQAMDGGTVTTTLGSACTENAASESSKTVSCNGATSANPTYTITAAGTSLADVVLTF